MRPFIFSILIILSIYNVYANEADRYCGRWEYIPEDIILYPGLGDKKKDPLFKEIDIVRIGTIEQQYYVWMSQNRGFTFRQLNDTTLYSLINDDTTLLHYHVKSNTLQFSPIKHGFVGARLSYFPHFKRIGVRNQVAQVPDRTESFFNYNVNRYESLLQIKSLTEIDFYPFPFAISESFIARRKIRQLEIKTNWVKNKIPEEHRYLFDFDPKGHVISMLKFIGDSLMNERWSFNRRKDGSLLTSTQITYDDGRQHKKEYQYDVDSWPVDNTGQKIIDDIYEWEMADAYHPKSVRRKESLAWLSYEFQNNELRTADIYRLTRKLLTFSFEYSADGVLTRIRIQSVE